MMRLLFALLLTTYYLLLTTYKVAAAPFSLSASPPILEIVAKPSDNVESQMQVSNETGEPLSLGITFIPFVPKAQAGEGEVEFLNIELPIKDIVTIEDQGSPIQELTLRAKETRHLVLHISIPAEQEANDYYFSVVFLSKSTPITPTPDIVNEGEVRAYSTLRGGIAINVLLSTDENQQQTPAQIIEFSSPSFLQRGPVDFKIGVKNTGKHFIKAGGTILITNMFGQKIAHLTVSPQYVLAQSTRIYPSVTFPETFLLGPYIAELIPDPSLSYLGQSYKTTFYAFPIKQFLVGTFIVIMFLVIKKKVGTRLSPPRQSKRIRN